MSAYGTVQGADDYHSARGNLKWAAASGADREVALLRGSEYIDATFRGAWPGYKTDGRSQLREWPRTDAFVQDGAAIVALPANDVPIEVEHASYEAALRELGAPGFLTPDVIPGKQKKRVNVAGVVAVEYWSNEQKPMVEAIGMILAPLFAVNGQRSRLSGKVRIA